jgi:DnaJ-class molecular chaperone
MDYYEELGLERDCSTDDIKRAYRKLALKYHPDKTGNKERERFLKIQEAYEVLSDESKRQQYDNPCPDFGDLLGDMLNNMFRPAEKRTQDIHLNVTITLKEYLNHTKKTVSYERTVVVNLENVVENGYKQCQRCKGVGHIIRLMRQGPVVFQQRETCKCDSGYVLKDGYKTTKQEHTLEINIDSENFNRCLIYEQGHISGEGTGKVIVHLELTDDSFMIHDNLDLVLHKKLSVFESITGTSFNMLHPDGRLFKIITPTIMNGFTRIIRGGGIPYNGKVTNLVINFEVIYPNLTTDEIKTLKYSFSKHYHISVKGDKCIDFT